MRKMGLILRAAFLMLAMASICPNDQDSTFTSTGLRPTFEAGVLIGDYFDVIVICLVLVLGTLGKIADLKANTANNPADSNPAGKGQSTSSDRGVVTTPDVPNSSPEKDPADNTVLQERIDFKITHEISCARSHQRLNPHEPLGL